MTTILITDIGDRFLVAANMPTGADTAAGNTSFTETKSMRNTTTTTGITMGSTKTMATMATVMETRTTTNMAMATMIMTTATDTTNRIG